jgi:hypothetical protein
MQLRLASRPKKEVKDSPLFTNARQQNITKTINEAYLYLSNFGFPLERELPPIKLEETDKADGKRGESPTAFNSHQTVTEAPPDTLFAAGHKTQNQLVGD